MAVSAFSPPESCIMFWSFLPGGWEMILIPASRMSSSSASSRVPRPPPNSSLKPSPFCLLDEIEAALDDSNVGRFAGYLQKLTKNTQFIIITHRRGTMNAADRLYGITMQEKGVSTLVSVDLVENQLTQ